MTHPVDACKAKVFLSCGQSPDGECAAAGTLTDVLEKIGYEVYVAIEAQNLGGVDAIIRQLKSSEYFLFVDFLRKACPPFSLFAHQELAVAYSCGLQSAFLQESGADQQGMTRYLFTNPVKFERSADDLAAKVRELIRIEGWRTDWKNALTVEEPIPEPNVIGKISMNGKLLQCRLTYFHVPVANRHKQRVARRCVAYLTHVVDSNGAKVERTCPIEQKWAGYCFPEATIRAQTNRLFDAFFVITEVLDGPVGNVGSPIRPPADSSGWNTAMVTADSSSSSPSSQGQEGTAYFNPLTDFSAYKEPLPRGDYRFTYEILAEDFPATEAVFDVHIDEHAEKTTMNFREQSFRYT